MKRAFVLMTLCVLGPAACGDDAMEPLVETLELSFTGLEPLANGFHYEGWAIVGGAAVTTGKFNVDASGDLVTVGGDPIVGGAFETGLDLSGTTAIVLAMIEDDELGLDLTPASPIHALRAVSNDPTLRQRIELADGSMLTALELQWEYHERARKYAEVHGLDCVGEAVGADVLERWEDVLTRLETDPVSAASMVDWVAKYRLVDGYRERHGLEWDDGRLAAIGLQYHDLRPDKCLALRAGLETIADPAAVERAVTDPPPSTRAFFRGRCLQKWPEAIVAANWDSLVFDVGGDPLRRVPMMEPSRGTEDHVGTLIEECETAAELLSRLGS